MTLFSFLRRHSDPAARVATEGDVFRAAAEFARKEKLVGRFEFLPAELSQAARDAALNRFLEVLLSHMRS